MSYYIDLKDLICPYCEHENDVPHERMDFDKPEETQIVTCEKCRKRFKALVDFDPRYTTEVMEEDELLELN